MPTAAVAGMPNLTYHFRLVLAHRGVLLVGTAERSKVTHDDSSPVATRDRLRYNEIAIAQSGLKQRQVMGSQVCEVCRVTFGRNGW